MANTFLSSQQIAATALGVLEREIVLPGLVWRDAVGNFSGAGGDTVSIRVPARTTSNTRQLRGARPDASEGAGIIAMSELTEHKVDVTLDEDIYNAIPITDEDLTLSISDFTNQVLTAQVRAVAEGLENKLAAEMTGATYATTLDVNTTDPYLTLIDARMALNTAHVPINDRLVVVGPEIEALFLKSEHLSMADKAGDSSALRDAQIGRIAGFGNVYVSNALPANVGFVFHRTAYVLSTRAPAVPEGATYGSSQSYAGVAMRWLRDYDFRNVQDRSLLDVFAGANIIADGPDDTFVRAVKLQIGTDTSTG